MCGSVMKEVADPFISHNFKPFYLPWDIRIALEDTLEGLIVPCEKNEATIFIHFYFHMQTFEGLDNDIIVRAFVNADGHYQEKTFYLEKTLFDFIKDKVNMGLYITKDCQIKSSLIGEFLTYDI